MSEEKSWTDIASVVWWTVISAALTLASFWRLTYLDDYGREAENGWATGGTVFFGLSLLVGLLALLEFWTDEPPSPPDLSALDAPVYGYSRSAVAEDIRRAGLGLTPNDGQR